jgi:hypothetical protein
VTQRLLVVTMLFLGLGGCHEEPPIVIKFEPVDAAATAPRTKVAPLADAAIATASDAGAAKAHATAPATSPQAACKAAADCVVVPVECCDCANGGKQQAVTKDEAKTIATARESKCKHAMCTMMMSTDPSCGMRADCVAGKCVMVAKKK